MYDTNISISVRQAGEGVYIIDIRGGLTAVAESALFDAFTQAGTTGARVILFGFTDLTYMNSAGIGLLVRLVIRAQRQAQQILAFGLQEHFRRVFELTRLQEVIRIFATEEEALQSTQESASA